YKVGPRCSVPGCNSWADDVHHMVRKSDLGDWSWFEYERTVYPNLTGLCRPHHRDVTGEPSVGHKAAIRLVDGQFIWCEVVPHERNGLEYFPLGDQRGNLKYLPLGALDPQPPNPQERASEPTGEVCPACGQKRRRRVTLAGSRRRRKTWCIKVP